MRKHKSDRSIGILTFILLAFGLIVIYAIGPQRANFMNSAYGSDYSPNFFFWHQLISVALSAVAFVFAFKFPYERVRTVAKYLMFAGLIMCAMLAVLAAAGSSLATCQLGGCRWFNLGVASFQPAEFVKLGMVLYLAQLAATRRSEGTLEQPEFLVPFAVVTILALFFVVIAQKDMGTGVAIIMIALTILFMSGIKLSYIGIAVAVLLAGGMFAIVTSPHRMERVFTFMGEGDSDDTYHIDNALMAIGTGGLFGVGFGNSVQATGYLPESINDSVFAVMGETVGFVGLAVVVLCFAVLLYKILRVSTGLPLEQSLICSGVFAWIITHVLVNIAAMTGLIPLTGITLPLLSYGGTSMIFVAYSIGLVLQLSCYTGREVNDESISSRRGVGRTHYTSSRRSA